MRLYMIQRKSDREFFVGVNGHYILASGKDGQTWTGKAGRFFRTPDGVAGNLRRLCSQPYWNFNPPPGVCPAVANGWREVAWHDFDARKLDAYEVVTMEVDILSMKACPASEFVQIDAIQSAPLNKFERLAS